MDPTTDQEHKETPEVNQPEVPATPEPQQEAVSLVPKKSSSKKKLMILLGILIALGAAAAIYLLVIKDSKPAQSTTTAKMPDTAKTTAQEVTESEKQLDRLSNPTTGETWNSAPKELPLQGFLTTKDFTENSDEIKYFEVGKRADNTIIMSLQYNAGEVIELYEKSPAGKVTAIARPDANAVYKDEHETYLTDRYRSDITINKTQRYDSLSVPSKISLGNDETADAPEIPYLGVYIDNSNPSTNTKETLVKKYGSSSLSKVERKYADTGLTAISYVIKFPIGTELTLAYAPIKEDFATVKWDDGSTATGKFGGIVRGCGAGISVSRSDTLTDVDFVKAGSASNGQAIYNFKDKSNSVVQKAWQETKLYYDGSDATKANISIDEFMKKHAVFAYKSNNQGWLIYTSDEYAPIGGCAKPVVYLYPTVTQNVTVKVGADVKISDPLYNPATGWKVLAQPNGNLKVDGANYGSLFWEGPGYGSYPGIASGTVVKRADAEATIRQQLKQQGLNTTEIHDFMVYWTDRIPNKPYVRLSWFNTAQMNELAPLTITPRPTTVIRVFLDMAGYDKPVSLPQQTFTAPKRTGFTVVEWGGLSLTKLY